MTAYAARIAETASSSRAVDAGEALAALQGEDAMLTGQVSTLKWEREQVTGSVAVPVIRNPFLCAFLLALTFGGGPAITTTATSGTAALESNYAANSRLALAPQLRTGPLLAELNALSSGGGDIQQAFEDAKVMAAGLHHDIPLPTIWTDNESEIVFEWKDGAQHAAMSFEGDSHFAYAMLKGDLFVPGSEPGSIQDGFPADLTAYLNAARRLS